MTQKKKSASTQKKSPSPRKRRPKKKTGRKTEEKPPEAEEHTFPIVGIGASAGGLEAFEQFFAKMPPDSGMAFVLVQHLSSPHKSILADLVQRKTSMKVYQVTDRTKVQPNCVYIIPPNSDMALLHGELHLIEPDAPRGLRLPIDFFFRSLAQDQHKRAICIVLSGTGTDGTLGLKAVNAEGGMSMVQSPISAKYDGMPRSAIQTDLVDYILPAEEMPKQLISYVGHALSLDAKPDIAPIPETDDSLQKIFILLRAQTGHDFSYYKQNTIGRRIERRMAVNQIEKLSAYVRFVQKNPLEVETLFRELLIGVTNFFRDPAAFDVLEEKIIPSFFEDRPIDEAIRVWVPGCSTGEEAYSIAILLRECMDTIKRDHKIQIFATDIDSDAIQKARTGIYPDGIVADVSEERLKRFFSKENSSYRVRKTIRDMVIFAEQNIIGDPPFSKMDLISCRNLLIYMQTVLQKRVLPLFHYSLKEDGLLFLGNSETVGEFRDLFSVVNRKSKIYQRKNIMTGQRPLLEFPPPPFMKDLGARQLEKIVSPVEKMSLSDLVKKELLQRYTPTCVIINEKGEMLYSHGRTGKYFEPASGEASLNILRMAREGLRLELTTALRKSIATQKEVVYQGLKIKTNGDYQAVNLKISPVMEPATMVGLLMVLFEDVSVEVALNADEVKVDGSRTDKNKYIQDLERELRNKEEYLQATVEELETSNEELKSTNEELQSSNEELQSTNEEMETSKEELQSVNEELVTVNTEHQMKIDELSQANNDMSNLLASTQVGTIFLDQQLHIKRFTPIVAETVNLIQADIGRPIGHITSKFIDYDDFEKDAKAVLDTLIPKEVDMESDKGRRFIMRILPYRTTKNVIDGLVITFVDITDQKEAENAIRESDTKYRGLFNSIRDAILIADTKRNIIDFNPAFTELFGYILDDIQSKQTSMLYESETEFIELGRSLQAHYGDRSFLKTVRYQKKNGEVFQGETGVFFLKDDAGEVVGYIGVIRDVTAQIQMEDALLTTEIGYRLLFENVNAAITLYDTAGKITMLNDYNAEVLGGKPDDFIGKSLGELFPEQADFHLERFAKIMQDKRGAVYEDPFPLADGIRWFRSHLVPMLDTAGNVTGIQIVSYDITEHKQTENALKESEMRLQLAARQLGLIFAQVDLDLRYTWIYNPHPDFNPETSLGKRDTEIADNEGTRRLQQLKTKVIETGQEQRERITFPLTIGMQKYDIRAEPLRDNDDNLTGVTTYAVNITEPLPNKKKD
ncbi:MAG: PAS domain S-box protein [Chloroflexi bacterium]|nr:PAS domain S-box protein [Chloroflexota bacterium]